ncbi:antiterminator Q family protein [Providencia stuartii]|uniref:antiterminator Q family protein n=1 Tax=Providencia sp. PROV189 TaxID=2949890 RepID=UPI002349D22D|nr:antiterminator Q family protein [Providencia sp. PROV189]
MMNRNVQQILTYWGGWSYGDHCGAIGWSSVSAGFRDLVTSTSKSRPMCSDEDGLVIDLCVAKLGVVGMERERSYIEDYYVKGYSKRAIGRKYKVREGEIRERIQVAESFILGCLETLNIQLDIDILCAQPVIKSERRVRAQNIY